MRAPEMPCKHGRYDSRMRIRCEVTGGLCAYQQYKPCRGWCEMTQSAMDCLAGRGGHNGDERGEG